MVAGVVSAPAQPILVSVDVTGTGDFRPHPDRPTITSNAGPALELMVHGRSSLVETQTEIHIAVVDANANPATSFDGR
jgi:hypothetical protein